LYALVSQFFRESQIELQKVEFPINTKDKIITIRYRYFFIKQNAKINLYTYIIYKNIILSNKWGCFYCIVHK